MDRSRGVAAVCFIALWLVGGAGCGTTINCPRTGYQDGHAAGEAHAEATQRASDGIGRSPSSTTYWRQYYRAGDIMNESDAMASACSEYFYEFSAGYTDGYRDWYQEYQEQMRNQATGG